MRKQIRDTLVLVFCIALSFVGGMLVQGSEQNSHAAIDSPVIVTPAPTITPTPSPIPIEKDQRYITVTAINKFLKNKLKNKGAVIYDACKAQNPPVNATLATAIILLEVGGDCNSPLLNNAENVGGLNWFEGCGYPKYGWYINFKNHGGIDASIKMKASILSRYLREGRKDIESIGLKYAPPNDPRNGIGGMDNTTWPLNVKRWYNKINNVSKTLA